MLLNEALNISKVSDIPIGSGKGYSVKEVARIFLELINSTKTLLNFGALLDREGENISQVADITFLQSLAFKPKFSLLIDYKDIIKNKYA